jgi:hypothetical protein
MVTTPGGRAAQASSAGGLHQRRDAADTCTDAMTTGRCRHRSARRRALPAPALAVVVLAVMALAATSALAVARPAQAGARSGGGPSASPGVSARSGLSARERAASQALRYVRDLRRHPASGRLRRGTRVALGSDDPSIFGTSGLSDDFAMASSRGA